MPFYNKKKNISSVGFKPNTKIYRKIHLQNGNDTMQYNLNHVRQPVVHFCNHHRLPLRRLVCYFIVKKERKRTQIRFELYHTVKLTYVKIK